MSKKQKRLLYRILISALLLMVVLWMPKPDPLALLLFLVPYVTVGYDILWSALCGLWNRQPFDENFLMAVASVGALCLGEYTEGVAVMLLYQVGELFQSYAVGKSRKNISALMDIRPETANLEEADGEVRTVSPSDVAVGSVIIIRPGERIPLDGEVLLGNSTLDTVALTGESVPRSVAPGDSVLSGCINQGGLLKVRTNCTFEGSTVAKILDLVENASARKSRSEHFISKFARVYTPAVCLGALLLAVIPSLFTGNWNVWVYRALSFLVISCPCALVISIPLSFFAAIGGAGKQGILIKGSNYIETLSKIKTMVFDKTGTLTQGTFEVAEVHAVGISKEELLAYAAGAEFYSSHPISRSLQRAYGRAIDPETVSCTEEFSGRGILATVSGHQVLVGNDRLMVERDIEFQIPNDGGTVVYVALDGAYVGSICIADTLKADADTALLQLRKCGITKTVLLTGDSVAAAEPVAKKLKMDEWYAALLPGDKVEKVEQLLSEKDGKLAFVGDGINDAPVLTRSDIGVAMGALGSDAAIEAADVVLMDDALSKLPLAVKLSQKCMRIVYQNIVFAIGVKLICLILGAMGITNMWFAIFADVGVMVLAVLNAVRVLK